ncbi:hypothetical protein DOX45_11715 [Cronobacter malonaticus]|jgi:hypothetical protein|nr:hypothetical protein [Cronobacter malonaticus]
MVYQNNIKTGFHKLAKEKKPLTLASLKGNTDITDLNYIFNTTLKNHSFEYLLRNLFNGGFCDSLFESIVFSIADHYDFEAHNNLRYYLFGQDSITDDLPLDNFNYKIPTHNGWIKDKSKIKEMIRHCDVGIELFKPFSQERILILGEVEGLNGQKLLTESYWINDKKALSDNRYYHFGIGITPTNVDLKTANEIPKHQINKHLLSISKYQITVYTFDQITNLPKDIEYAIEDIKKIFSDGKSQPVNSLFNNDFYTSLKDITQLIIDYWNEDIRNLLFILRGICGDTNNSDNNLTTISLSIQHIGEGFGITCKHGFYMTFPPLTATERLINLSKTYEKSNRRDKKANDTNENIEISSIFTGNITLPQERKK